MLAFAVENVGQSPVYKAWIDAEGGVLVDPYQVKNVPTESMMMEVLGPNEDIPFIFQHGRQGFARVRLHYKHRAEDPQNQVWSATLPAE